MDIGTTAAAIGAVVVAGGPLPHTPAAWWRPVDGAGTPPNASESLPEAGTSAGVANGGATAAGEKPPGCCIDGGSGGGTYRPSTP
jgi:hypothetical protein